MQSLLFALAMVGMTLGAPSPEVNRRQLSFTTAFTNTTSFWTFSPFLTYKPTGTAGTSLHCNATATAHANSTHTSHNATRTASRYSSSQATRVPAKTKSPAGIYWSAAKTNPPYWYLREGTDGTETTHKFDHGYLKEEYRKLSRGFYSEDAQISELRKGDLIIFNNKCDRGFDYTRDYHRVHGSVEHIAAHAVHTTPYVDPRANGGEGGITFKLGEIGRCERGPITQIEYSTNPDHPGVVWADISNVDCGSSRHDHNSEPCPLRNDGIMLLWPEMSDCPKQIAPAGSVHPPEVYNLPYDDWGTMNCPARKGAMEVILCPTVADIEHWCGFDETWGPRCYPPAFFDSFPKA